MEGIPHSNHLNKSAFKEDELVLLFAPSHPWRFQSVIEPEALRKEPFFMREKGSGGREVLESALLLQGIEIQPAWESISTQAIISGVENGLGVTVLPFLLAKPSLDQGKLLTRPITGLALRRRLYIIWHKNKYVTEAMRDFMQICRDMP